MQWVISSVCGVGFYRRVKFCSVHLLPTPSHIPFGSSYPLPTILRFCFRLFFFSSYIPCTPSAHLIIRQFLSLIYSSIILYTLPLKAAAVFNCSLVFHRFCRLFRKWLIFISHYFEGPTSSRFTVIT